MAILYCFTRGEAVEMIELELWRARIGLNHAGAAGRVDRLLKKRFKGLNKSFTVEWQSNTEQVYGIPFALLFLVSLMLIRQCVVILLQKRTVGNCNSQPCHRDVQKQLLPSGVPLLLKLCVAMIPLLLLLAGDVERNPGPVEGRGWSELCYVYVMCPYL